MDTWQVVRYIHKLGSPLSGTVIAVDGINDTDGIAGRFIHIDAGSRFPAVLPYRFLADSFQDFDKSKIPAVGERVDAVVFNCVDGALYLSTRPTDLNPATISAWQKYYEYIDTIQIGDSILGTVKRVKPFGIFVDIGGEYDGLIDVGHASMVSTPQLPHNVALWSVLGDLIQCKIEYLRLHNRQIGLGWLPEMGA